MLVVAGPGSGKTTVITHRILKLIRQDEILPGNILVITFTKMAANQMKERFLSLYGQPVSDVTFGTFHSVFLKILRYAYGMKFESVISETSQLKVIYESCRAHGFRMPYRDPFYYQILSAIGRVKNGLADISEAAPAECEPEAFDSIFEEYQHYLLENRYLDFDDIQIYCRDLLCKREDVLKAWHGKYQYILVDEFQDCSPIQYDLLRLLAAPEDNLFFVGDDDQSIYSFRGATPVLMQKFLRDYPDAQQVTLGSNYRCHPEIIRSSYRLISHNRMRLSKKEALPAVTFSEQTGAVSCQSFHDQRSEMMFMRSQIRTFLASGRAYRDIAILTRTNAQLTGYLAFFDSYQIPCICKEYLPDPFRHWVVEDLLIYLKLAAGDVRKDYFIRIMNRPNRFLSRAKYPQDPFSFLMWEKNYSDQDWMCKRIRKLENDLSVMSGMRPFAAVIYVLKAVGYEEWLKEYAASRGLVTEDLLEMTAFLTNEAKKYDTIPQLLNAVDFHKEKIDRQTDSDPDADGIRLMTYHSAKGLEYPVVFLPDLCDGIIPYHRAITPEAVEEERRMLYVAMTRAKEKLFLMATEEIRDHKKEPSVFLLELQEDL